MTKPTLLVSGGGVTQPMWAQLSERYRLAFFHPQAAQLAHDLKLPDVVSVMDAAQVNADAIESAENNAALLAARVVNAMPSISARIAGITAFAPNAPAELNGKLPDWWAGYALHHFRDHTMKLTALENLAREHPIVGCLTHEDVSPEARTLVLWAKARGIPTLHLPHAPCHLHPGVRDIHRETRADWVLASGPRVAAFYADCGVPDNRIAVVGAPQWDALYEAQLPDRAEAREVLGVKTARVICYASTWPQTTSLRSGFEREMDAGLDAALKLAENWKAVVMVKVHPHEHAQAEQFYAAALQQADIPGLVTRQHLTYLLRAADVLVAQGPSNLCLEAAIMGVPSVYLQTEGFDFASALPARCAPDTLGAVASALLDAPPSRADLDEFVSEYNAAHPLGEAADCASEFVERICHSA